MIVEECVQQARRDRAAATLSELNETRDLVRALNRFIYHYKLIHRSTAHAELVEKAGGRAEEALIECMRKATDDLSPR